MTNTNEIVTECHGFIAIEKNNDCEIKIIKSVYLNLARQKAMQHDGTKKTVCES